MRRSWSRLPLSVACLDGAGTGIAGHAAGELCSRVNRGWGERKREEREGGKSTGFD